MASDKDLATNARITYYIRDQTPPGDNFLIDSDTGQLRLSSKGLDYEMTREYLLTIAARDGLSTDSVRLTSTFTLKVNVEDVNDNAPLVVISTLTGTDGAVAGVKENGAPGVLVALVTVSDHDSHLNGQATCYTDSEAFTLVALRTGHRYKLITTRSLDREATPSFHVRVTCTDLGRIPLTGNATITINVLDVNDFRPVFPAVEYEFRIREKAPLGSKVGVVKARDDDLNPDLVYTITGTNVLEVTSGGQLILVRSWTTMSDLSDTSSA